MYIFSFKHIINFLLFFLMLLFLIFSLYQYFSNKLFYDRLVTNHVSLFQIDITNKNKEIANSFGSLVSEAIMTDLLVNEFKNIPLQVRFIDSTIVKYNELYTYGVNFTITVQDSNNDNLYKSFNSNKQNLEEYLKIIFQNRIETIKESNKGLEKEIINSESDQYKVIQDVLSSSLIAKNCQNFKVSPDINVSFLTKEFKDKNQDVDISYYIVCLDDIIGSADDYLLTINLSPFYKKLSGTTSINSLYVIYVLFTFIFGIFLILLNIDFIRTSLKLNK